MPLSFDTEAAVTRLVVAGEKPAVAEIIATTMAEIVADCVARPHGDHLSDGLRGFDTLTHAKRLMAAGMPQAVAEAHALTMWDLVLVPLRQAQSGGKHA